MIHILFGSAFAHHDKQLSQQAAADLLLLALKLFLRNRHTMSKKLAKCVRWAIFELVT